MGNIGHMTAVFNSGAMSPLFNECLHSIYRGSLSSSAHSFKSITGKRSVPGAALFLPSFIASIIDFRVKSISSSIGSALSSFMEKNSIEFSILYLGSGWEKLEEYCCTNFIHISNKLVNFSPSISKGPILFLVLSFFLAYVKKYLGFDFMFSIARASFTIFSSLYEFNNFLSISPMAFSIHFFLSGGLLFCSSLFSIFFFLNSTLLSLGILFDCDPR